MCWAIRTLDVIQVYLKEMAYYIAFSKYYIKLYHVLECIKMIFGMVFLVSASKAKSSRKFWLFLGLFETGAWADRAGVSKLKRELCFK